MLYELKLDHETEQFVLNEWIKFGGELPAMIRDAPTLQPGLQLYSRAFRELSTCRQIGMGIGPIPWTAINDWIRVNGIPPDQAETLRYHIGEMDAAYLEWVNRPKQ